MDLKDFIKIIDASGEFERITPIREEEILYESDDIGAIVINGIIVNPSQIGISGNSIHFWINPSLQGFDLNEDILLCAVYNVIDDIDTFEVN